MASPEKTIVAIACKDGKVTLQVKHPLRGIVGEAEIGTGDGAWSLEFPGVPAIISAAVAKQAPQPKSPPTAKVTRKAKAKPTAPSAEPVEEAKPKDDFQLSGEDGL